MWQFSMLTDVNWANLASGFVGSVFGAIAGVAATVWATNKTIRHTVESNSRAAIEAEFRANTALWRGLRTEIQENLRTLRAPAPGGFTLRVQLLADFWDRTKGSIHLMPAELQQELIDAFVIVKQHNEIVLYDRAAITPGLGMADGAIRRLQIAIQDRLEKAEKRLETFLIDGIDTDEGARDKSMNAFTS